MRSVRKGTCCSSLRSGRTAASACRRLSPIVRVVPRFVLALLAAAIVPATGAHAERLPLRSYTVTNGLASNRTTRLLQDSRGFLWVGTIEGLSRFDGREFRTFRVADGLPGEVITALAESSAHDLWIGTGAGLCRLRAAEHGPTPFESVVLGASEGSRSIDDLAAAVDGSLWIATDDGLFIAKPRDDSIDVARVTLTSAPGISPPGRILSLLWSRDGLIAGTKNAVYRVDASGRASLVAQLPEEWDTVNDLIENAGGDLWLATRVGIARVRRSVNRGPGRVEFVQAASPPYSHLTSWTNQLMIDRRGHIWAVGFGLTEIDPVRGGPRSTRRYDETNGLCGEKIEAVLEDRDGNLWLGSQTCGLLKLERTGLISYGPSDGITTKGILALVQDGCGAVCAIPRIDRWYCTDGDRFVEIAPRGVARLSYLAWSWNQAALQDREGGWWLAAGGGLVRFPSERGARGLARRSPVTTYADDPAIRGHDVFRVFEDSRGDVWVGFADGGTTVVRWERAAGTFHRLTAEGGGRLQQPGCFAEDASGAVWVGFLQGDLRRVEGATLVPVPVGEGKAPGSISAIARDRENRFWIATGEAGLWRIDRPGETAPGIRRYTREDGLVSNRVNTVAVGADGQIYAGTISGLNVLDPATDRIRHFATADGLANDWVGSSLCSRDGRLWIGTDGGLSMLVPHAEEAPRSPPIFVTALTVNGVPRPVSVRGEAEVTGLVLGPGETSVRIEVSGLSFAAGEPLRFQHRIEGEDWTPPSDTAGVTLARVSPGRYRVSLRAVLPDGSASASPAVVSFRVRPPFWRTGWFAAALGLTLAAVPVVAYRIRAARLLALERMRTRIAMDLHDDVGSSLSQIALRSELALSQLDAGAGSQAQALEHISEESRGLVDAMSDVVWSVDPRHDVLSDLVRRIRSFALDAAEARGVEVRLDLPSPEKEIPLPAQIRRQVYLVFKESFTNALRHAGASRIDVTLTAQGHAVVLRVSDDGRGIAGQGRESGGHGLDSMRRRAEDCGGSLEVLSTQDAGTTITLRLELS